MKIRIYNILLVYEKTFFYLRIDQYNNLLLYGDNIFKQKRIENLYESKQGLIGDSLHIKENELVVKGLLKISFDKNISLKTYEQNVAVILDRVKFTGTVNNVVATGLIYIDVEKMKDFPFEYTKVLFTDFIENNYHFTCNNLKFISKEKSHVLFVANDKKIKDIVRSLIYKKNDMIIKGYSYKYTIKHNINVTKLYDNNIKISESLSDITVSKNHLKPFVNNNKKKMLIITYKF